MKFELHGFRIHISIVLLITILVPMIPFILPFILKFADKSCIAFVEVTKIEVKREIQTMISGKQMECKVMNLIPLGIILYFWIASPGFLDCMYTMSGRPVMTVLMIVYIAAFKWSERIGDITV